MPVFVPRQEFRRRLRFPYFLGVALGLINHSRPKVISPSISLPIALFIASEEHTDVLSTAKQVLYLEIISDYMPIISN